MMEHQRGGARTSRAARAPQPSVQGAGRQEPPAGGPNTRGGQGTAEALYAPAGPFRPPPSYTHRHCFQVARAPCRSCPHLRLPPRDLLWEKQEIDSRLGNRPPVSHSDSTHCHVREEAPEALRGAAGRAWEALGARKVRSRELPYRTYPIQLTLQDIPYRTY